jgi:GT2 family glycosyltransferase
MINVDLSVCIVNWNGIKYLPICIDSIMTCTEGINYEIIIHDNASSDGSVALLESDYPMVRVLANNNNVGFASGNNIASKVANGRYILYLNPDTELRTNALEGMVRFMDQNPEYGAIGCKLENSDGTIQYTCARTFPTPFNQFCYLAMINRLFPSSKIFSSVEIEYWDHNNSRDIDCISGACLLVRKEVNDIIGGFDENIFMYGEDVDICYRIRDLGYKIYYLATERIVHYGGKSSDQIQSNNFSTILQRHSNYYFLNKTYGIVRATNYRVSVGVGSLIRLIYALIYNIGKLLQGKQAEFVLFRKYKALFQWSLFLGQPKA